MATSPGARGGQTILESAKAYFPYLGAKVVANFSLPSFYDNFANGEISDESLQQELYQSLSLFKQAFDTE